MQLILKMNPPTTTAQMHKVGVRNGKPYFYDPPEVKDAKSKIMAHLSKHVPAMRITEPVILDVKWLYQIEGHHKHGEWRDTKPDTDNLQKLLKDCMTQMGFWRDDAQVVRETVEKRWVDHSPGIYINIMTAAVYEKQMEEFWGID